MLDESACSGWETDAPSPEAEASFGGGRFGSVGELSMSAFEDHSNPGVLTPKQLEKATTLSVTMYKKQRAENSTRKLVLARDLEEDVDCPTEQYMVENIWYRSEIQEHPITNARTVPLWVADDSISSRAAFKMTRQNTTWDVSRRHGAADPVGHKPFYPDHYQALYKQNVDIREKKMRTAQRAAEAQTIDKQKHSKTAAKKKAVHRRADVPEATQVHRAYKKQNPRTTATPPPPPPPPQTAPSARKRKRTASGPKAPKRSRRE